MFDRIRQITLFISALVLVVFVIFVINQTAQVVSLAADLHPVAGFVVLGLLVAAYVVFVAVPLVLYFKLPAPLEPPLTDSGPEFDEHLDNLRQRLAGNPLVEGDLPDRAAIEAAVTDLDARATEVVKEAASQVFLTTAISQSGRLDTFMVLSANVRLVWRVARIYYQRPTLRDMWHLYANVAATAFMAGEIDDVDVSEQVQPIVTSVLGSVGTAIPGMQVATSVIVNSVLGGSTNAFLTLRIGAITQQYSAPLVSVDRRKARRFASARAAGMLGGIVSDGARNVIKAVARASRDRLLRRKSGDESAAPGDIPEEVSDELEALVEDESRWSWLWERNMPAVDSDAARMEATD